MAKYIDINNHLGYIAAMNNILLPPCGPFTPASTSPDDPDEVVPDFPFDPVPLRERHDGWTPERQADFIAALAETGCVDMAAKAVGKSTQTAYRLRRHFDAQSFRQAWDAALDYAIRRLSDAVYSRAIHGVPVPHYYKGELVGEHRRYNDRLAMFLMRYRDPLKYGKHLDDLAFFGDTEMFAIKLARFMNAVESEIPAYPPKKKRGQKKAARVVADNHDSDGQVHDTPPIDMV